LFDIIVKKDVEGSSLEQGGRQRVRAGQQFQTEKSALLWKVALVSDGL